MVGFRKQKALQAVAGQAQGADKIGIPGPGYEVSGLGQTRLFKKRGPLIESQTFRNGDLVKIVDGP